MAKLSLKLITILLFSSPAVILGSGLALMISELINMFPTEISVMAIVTVIGYVFLILFTGAILALITPASFIMAKDVILDK